MSLTKLIILLLLIGVIAGAIMKLESNRPLRSSNNLSADDIPDSYKEISNPAGFINTDKVVMKDLIGKKVVLVDFWTYSCINCQRTLPFLTSWHEKYKDQGLEIIGIHTPEFDFERERENVEAAVKKYNIRYPVVMDNDYAVWTAYNNRYWPRKYLINIHGKIVYDHIGEGAYQQTEAKIQESLKERLQVLGEKGQIDSSLTNIQIVPLDASKVKSPEVYFGSFRNETLANGTPNKEGVQNLVVPATIDPHKLYLEGSWDIKNQYAQNQTSQTKIIFKYEAKDVYIVAGSEKGVNITVRRDGKIVSSEAGLDVNKVSGQIEVKEERLYKIIEDPSGYGEHTLELIIHSPGLQIFTFTFG